MTFGLTLLPALVALALGFVAARRFPALGLVAVLCLVIAAALARPLFGLERPSILDVVILVALVQAGYLGGALLSEYAKTRRKADASAIKPTSPDRAVNDRAVKDRAIKDRAAH